MKLNFISLEALQLAYKITANSVYGQCGAPTSSIYCGAISATVTSIGRNLIYNVSAKFIEKEYDAKCIYGDTDSIFIDLRKYYDKMTEGKELTQELTNEIMKGAMNLGIEMADRITKLINKPPLKIAFEKAISPLILMKKKNYCGMWFEGFASIGHPKFKMMGCAPKKRDYCPLVSKLFTKSINTLKDTKNTTKKNAKIALRDLYLDLVNIHKYPISDFTMTKSIKENYKNANRVAHKVLADRMFKRDPGNKVLPNTRLPFVYIAVNEEDYTNEYLSSTGKNKFKGCEINNKNNKNNNKTDDNEQNNKNNKKITINKKDILTGYRIEHPDYVINSNGKIKIDYDEYILKQIGKPIIADLFRLSVPLECLNYILYKIFMKRNGECGRVKIIVHDKKKIMPNGEEDIVTDVKIGIVKKTGSYVISRSDYYYINFLKSSKIDIDKEILIVED